jgi:hypothetical protein
MSIESHRVTTNLDRDVFLHLKQEADRRRRSLSSIIRERLYFSYMDDMEEEEKSPPKFSEQTFLPEKYDAMMEAITKAISADRFPIIVRCYGRSLALENKEEAEREFETFSKYMRKFLEKNELFHVNIAIV